VGAAGKKKFPSPASKYGRHFKHHCDESYLAVPEKDTEPVWCAD